MVYKNPSGKPNLLAANAGDARVVVARKGKAVQLTEDHVPDMCVCLHVILPHHAIAECTHMHSQMSHTAAD